MSEIARFDQVHAAVRVDHLTKRVVLHSLSDRHDVTRMPRVMREIIRARKIRGWLAGEW